MLEMVRYVCWTSIGFCNFRALWSQRSKGLCIQAANFSPTLFRQYCSCSLWSLYRFTSTAVRNCGNKYKLEGKIVKDTFVCLLGVGPEAHTHDFHAFVSSMIYCLACDRRSMGNGYFSAAEARGHGPFQPAHLRHLGDQFPHFPVALSQRQSLGVQPHQPRLPQPQWQAEGGVELKVTLASSLTTMSLSWSVQTSPKRAVCPSQSCRVTALVGLVWTPLSQTESM